MYFPAVFLSIGAGRGGGGDGHLSGLPLGSFFITLKFYDDGSVAK